MAGPRVTPYEREITASGTIGGNATPDDFGAGIVRGLDTLANGGVKLASDINQVDQDQGRIWASTAVSQKELQLNQDFQTRVNSMDPSAPDYPAKINSLTADTQAAYTQAQSDLMGQAPSASAKKFTAYHMANASLRGTDNAMRTQASLNGAYTTTLVQTGQKADEDVLAATPDNDTFQRLIDKNNDMVGGLTTIGPDIKLKLQQGQIAQLSRVQVASQVAADPQSFLTAVNVKGGITTSRGIQHGGVPAGPVENHGGDTVKPYGSGNIGAIVQQVQAPSEYDSLFQASGRKYGVDPQELKLRAVAESGLKPGASSGQANGIMQLAPATAKSLGVDANDPAQAIDGAARLLSNYQQKAGMGAPMYVAPGAPTQGMARAGNIDLTRRPIAKNADGNISTVRSMSFEEDGKEILVPTVSPDGKILSNDAAIDLYHKTGQHLGVFNNESQATAYAKSLHEQQAAFYEGQQSGGGYAAVDKMYYGGDNTSQWGPNTKQYAANLGAARAALSGASIPNPGDPQVSPLNDQDIAAAKMPLAGWGNLTWAEKVSSVRQAEALVGKSLATNRGQASVQVQDALSSFSAGKDYANFDQLKASLPALYGGDQAKRVGDQLDYARGVGGFIGKINTMPTAQSAAWLKQMEPQGGDEQAVKQPLYNQAVAAAASVQQMWQKAPIDTAIQNGVGNAQPLDFTSADKLGAGLKDRVALNNTLTRDYGAPDQIFTKDEAEQMDTGLGKMNGKDRISYLAAIKTSLNNPRAFSVAMNQVAAKNPLLSYAANMAATGATTIVAGKPVAAADTATMIADGDIILNGKSLSKDMEKGSDPAMPNGSQATSLDEKTFKDMFGAALGPAAFQSPDAQRSAATQTEVFNAVKAYYVADQYKSGQPLNIIDQNGFKKAVEAVTGGTWHTGSGGVLMAPFGKPMPEFQNEWAPRASQALAKAGYSPDEIDNTLSRGRPYNLADGQYGFLSGTRPLVSKVDGSLVRVNFADSYAAPPPPPPRAADAGLPMNRRY